MTIITGHYQWRFCSQQQHPVAGDYLRLSIELHYNSEKLEFVESHPFVCMEPKRFLRECKNFLCTFLGARGMCSICLTITNEVVSAIQKRFQFVPNTSTCDVIVREPHEFALHLIIVLRDDEYLNKLHVFVEDITEENGPENPREFNTMAPTSRKLISRL